MAIPDDYLHRVYAGVLGKLVGVYLGRPFENWTYQEIQERLGDIYYYVHEKFNVPLVVIDDDVSGTFAFVRALEEHGARPDLSSEEIGKTWLNTVIYNRSIFWWGGNGISTEHTAYLNLKNGVCAPESGAFSTNGHILAEQIGAQIFIDGWAMVAPGNPGLAVRLAEAAGKVSHDGEAVHAAKLWAAMEAEAFLSKNVEHLINTGLKYIPQESIIARMISDVRIWAQIDNDWRKTRQHIEDHYGYDKYPGICHVVPNHAIMIMALLYGGDNFHKAMHIINTCGWDTDCNSGNVACLVALMHGLPAFEGGPDWLGPLADRAIISSADGGYSVNNASRIAYGITNLGLQLAGLQPKFGPKDGAQFHFSLPGGVQGFRSTSHLTSPARVHVTQGDKNGAGCLYIWINDLKNDDECVEAMSEIFTSLEVLQVDRNYDIMASPLMYPGQTIKAEIEAEQDNTFDTSINIRLKFYKEDNSLGVVDSPPLCLQPGQQGIIEWTIPESLQNFPIQQVGLSIFHTQKESFFNGKIALQSLRWDGVPKMTLYRPTTKSQSFWERAWINSVDIMHTNMGPSFFLAQNHGEGLLYQGARDWTDYNVKVSKFISYFGGPMGVAVRIQGLRRYYALMFTKDKTVTLIKVRDDKRTEIASTRFEWKHGVAYDLYIQAKGERLTGCVGGMEITADDPEYHGGAMGLVVTTGSLGADSISIGPVMGSK